MRYRENAASLGGGIHVLLADIIVEDCVFSRNVGKGTNMDVGSRGGGIYVDGALYKNLAAPLDNGGLQRYVRTSFEENRSFQKGTGLYLCTYENADSNDQVYIEQCRFCGNIAEGPGEVVGAAMCPECDGHAYMDSCVLGGNEALTLSEEFNRRETIPEYQVISHAQTFPRSQ